jgi:glutamate formiminotransferase
MTSYLIKRLIQKFDKTLPLAIVPRIAPYLRSITITDRDRQQPSGNHINGGRHMLKALNINLFIAGINRDHKRIGIETRSGGKTKIVKYLETQLIKRCLLVVVQREQANTANLLSHRIFT